MRWTRPLTVLITLAMTLALDGSTVGLQVH